MLKLLIMMFLLTILNSFFLLIPSLIPDASQTEIYIYQTFTNAILILYLLLPKQVGDFDWDLITAS